MKILPFIFFILLVGKAMASSLPNCPSDVNARWHNCFGTYNFSSTGAKYIGEFKDDKFHGRGTFTWGKGPNEGDKHVGEYKDGKRHGQGTYTFSDGDKYVGEFKDSLYHGQGTYTYVSGTILRGYFMKDEYVPDICSGMGLTKGSQSFGQCVLKLIDKIDE